MQSVYSFLEFTTEVEEEYPGGYIPTLDFQMKMNKRGHITYKFFKKEMSNKYCVMAKAALSDDTKLAVLSQEVVRRMLTTSEDDSQEVRDNILNDFNRML